ncbi:MAG: Fic family protein [Terriglobia bacterium]|nr:Fic family protein [Terriglobia bacterium]
MNRGIQGRLAKQTTSPEPFSAFVPNPLPPLPPLEFTPELLKLKERADLALGRLDGIARLLPDLHLFLYFYVRKEAVLSSQIEGTQSSLSDLLLFENDQIPGVPIDDVQEVSNYVAALQHGADRIKDGFPISLRLIKEIHRVLLSKGRGSNKEPGEFRRTQNWIGGTRPGNARFVPPPFSEVLECMGQLEKFFHEGAEKYSTLVRAALIHLQFETIHPFLDGNGRVGRLLITLLLVSDKVLSVPLLYLSLYFKIHRNRYYELLQNVRFEGIWEDWLTFFFEAVEVTAQQAVDTAEKILQLFESDKAKINGLGRVKGSALQVHEVLQRRAFVTIPSASRELKLSQPAVTNALRALQALGIVAESTGRTWKRIYVYKAYLRLLNEGMDIVEGQEQTAATNLAG